jgi:DNA-binding NarL/FixJ family response regulator
VASALEEVLLRELAVSKRELAVIRLVATGLRNKEIAKALSITEGTVKAHLHSVYDKLRIRNRAGLAAHALRKGLL